MTAAPSSRFGSLRHTVWTIGHSTRSFEEFLALLQENRIEFLGDVRHFPRSQRVPWTAKESLALSLRDHGIEYAHFEDLGGYRKPRTDSLNTGWRNGGFRGYADHMASSEFVGALDRLVDVTSEKRTAITCAEALPWKCHRSLLSDSLLARGIRVVHILSHRKTQEHRLTGFAELHGGQVTYPAPKKGV